MKILHLSYLFACFVIKLEAAKYCFDTCVNHCNDPTSQCYHKCGDKVDYLLGLTLVTYQLPGFIGVECQNPDDKCVGIEYATTTGLLGLEGTKVISTPGGCLYEYISSSTANSRVFIRSNEEGVNDNTTGAMLRDDEQRIFVCDEDGCNKPAQPTCTLEEAFEYKCEDRDDCDVPELNNHDEDELSERTLRSYSRSLESGNASDSPCYIDSSQQNVVFVNTIRGGTQSNDMTNRCLKTPYNTKYDPHSTCFGLSNANGEIIREPSCNEENLPDELASMTCTFCEQTLGCNINEGTPAPVTTLFPTISPTTSSPTTESPTTTSNSLEQNDGSLAGGNQFPVKYVAGAAGGAIGLLAIISLGFFQWRRNDVVSKAVEVEVVSLDSPGASDEILPVAELHHDPEAHLRTDMDEVEAKMATQYDSSERIEDHL